jgi:hypothetical protein
LTRRVSKRSTQHVDSESDDFEDERKENAYDHEDESSPDVDEDENNPAPSLARHPDPLPPLLTNSLLLALSFDEMRTNRRRFLRIKRTHETVSAQGARVQIEF